MQKHINANKRNTILAIVGFIIFVVLIGCLFAYFYNDLGLIILFVIISVGYVVFQYYFADKEALLFSRAKQIQKNDNPKLFEIVSDVSSSMKIPMPNIYLIKDSAPNAFATGRDPEHSSVAVTSGLLEIMDKNELTSVIAHELSHIKNYDIRVSMIVFGLVFLVGLFSDLGFRLLFYGHTRRSSDEERSPIGFLIIIISAIVSPIAASLAQMAISREREYLADASSAKATGNPESMISALKKLDTHGRPMQSQNTASESMYINNPLKKGLFSNLFSTHPPIEKRIARLENAKKD
ncbi:M48 family metalloprotease [Candidatus Saccharibacteria bacterium]|nr:M48 family metalloprotease [Candidatus Saccharibacteria bacterium]